jgi:lipopolysaccharide cholinephosphotransferase
MGKGFAFCDSMRRYNHLVLDIKGDVLKRLQETELKILIEFDKACKKLGVNYSICGGTLIGTVRHKGFIPWDDDIDVAMLREDYEKFIAEGQKFLPDNLFIQTYESDKEYIHNFAKIVNLSTKLVERTTRNLNTKNGIYIDIFPIDAISNNKLRRKIDNFLVSTIYLIKHSSNILWIEKTVNPIRKTIKYILHPLSKFIGTQNLNRLETYIKVRNNKKENKLTYADYYLFPLVGFENINTMPIDIFKETQRIDFEGYKVLAVKDWDTYLTATYGNYMELPPEEKRVAKHNIVELEFET